MLGKRSALLILLVAIAVVVGLQVYPSGTGIKANVTSPVPHGVEVTYGGAEEYDWDVDGDGEYEKSGRQVTHTYDSPTNRTVRVRYQGNVKTYDIVVENNPPKVHLTQSPVISTGEKLVLNGTTITDPNNDPLIFEWDTDGDGDYDRRAPMVTVNYETTGKREVNLKATDEHGASDVGSMTVTVTK